MQLKSGFYNKRDLSQLQREELEDLDHHLMSRKETLSHKMEQMRRDMADLESDREQIRRILAELKPKP
jgi:prefoldin subunit 5